MNMDEGRRNLNHDEAWSLLPWLVNETLSGEEQTAVQTHVRSCLLCRRELGVQRQISSAVKVEPTIRISAQSSFASLMEKVDAGPAGFAAASDAVLTARRIIERTFRFWKETLSTNLRWVAATTTAAGCLIAVLLAITTVDDSSNSGRYSTLTAPITTESKLVEVVFADDVTRNGIDEVLQEVNGRIVEGPSKSGVYTITIGGEIIGANDEVPADRLLSAEQLDRAIRRLSDDPRVRFAGIAFGGRQPALP